MPQRGPGSSCAACKLLKRRCGPTCVFAPYFRSDEPKKFAKVHKVFGASNVSKILGEVPEEQREDTVNSLAYEAEARLRDPVYGCIGAIAILQRRMAELQHDLAVARARLARAAATAATTGSSNVTNTGAFELYDPNPMMVNCAGVGFGDDHGYLLGPENIEGFGQAETGWNIQLQESLGDYFGQSPFML